MTQTTFESPPTLDVDTLRGRLLEERARLLAQADSPSEDPELLRVETALEWLEKEEYGSCSICGEALPRQQLLVDPADMICADCRDLHTRLRRPMDAAAPPAGFISMADGIDALDREFRRVRRVLQT